MVPAPEHNTIARPPAVPCWDTTTAIEVDGVKTDIALHQFVNKIVLFITQYERISNVYLVQPNTLPGGGGGGGGSGSGSFENVHRAIECRFGTDTDEITSAIRYLVNAIPPLNEARMEVMITLGLREVTRDALRQVERKLRELM